MSAVGDQAALSPLTFGLKPLDKPEASTLTIRVVDLTGLEGVDLRTIRRQIFDEVPSSIAPERLWEADCSDIQCAQVGTLKTNEHWASFLLGVKEVIGEACYEGVQELTREELHGKFVHWVYGVADVLDYGVPLDDLPEDCASIEEGSL